MEEITHVSIRFLLYGVLFGMLVIMLLDTITKIRSKKENTKLLTNINKFDKANGITKNKG
tara:strand:+ start:8155 stop:8334 length:180 start_codon:yes stop_codon:yes gene_type:complete